MTPFVKIFVKLFAALAIVSGIAGFFIIDIVGIEMSPVRNLIHIAVGIIGLQMSASYGRARLFLIVFGFLFGALAIVGLTTGSGPFDYYQMSMNDNYLHILVSAALLLMGFGSKKKN